MANQRGRPMKARPRILQTACDLFLEHGLDVSLDAIASKAGTTRPTLYSHFPGGKDSLLLEAFTFLNDQMQPSVHQVLNDKQQDFPTLLLNFARMVQAHFYAPERIHFQRLLIQVLVQKPELYPELQKRPSGRVLQLLSDVLAQYSERGVVKLDDAETQAMAFLGAVMGYPFPAALIEQTPVATGLLDKLARSAVEAFLTAWQYDRPSLSE